MKVLLQQHQNRARIMQEATYPKSIYVGNITNKFVLESLLKLLRAARDIANREIDFMYNEDLRGIADDISVDISYLERSLEGSDAS
jgi:hypothetical protein